MTSNYSGFISQDRRLVILRILAEMPTYQANSSVLHTVLSQWGHDPSRDQVKGELRWLEEQQLVKIEDVSNGAVLVAKLTERGADVAAGRARVDGVKRPGA
ncbi:ArsR family transcriptional regulator [Pseudomonas aeruginosa]